MRDLLEPFRVKKGLEKFMGNSSTNGQSEGKRGMLLISLIQQLWVLQVDCRRWPCARASPAQSAAGDVVRQAVGLTRLGHFYLQTGGFSDLSPIPAPRSSWVCVGAPDSRWLHTAVGLQRKCQLCRFSHAVMSYCPGSGQCC